MSEPKYVKAQSFNRANIEDSLWYAQAEADKGTLLASENLQFGDKVYIIETKKKYILGYDKSWYEMG